MSNGSKHATNGLLPALPAKDDVRIDIFNGLCKYADNHGALETLSMAAEIHENLNTLYEIASNPQRRHLSPLLYAVKHFLTVYQQAFDKGEVK